MQRFRPGLVLLAIVVSAMLGATWHPAHAWVRVVSTVVIDNGGDDGWPDTRETVTLRLVVEHVGGPELFGVTALLESDDDRIACISDPLIDIGHLAGDEVRETFERFVFTVNDRDRASPAEDLSLSLSVWFVSNLFTNAGGGQITLDVDLNAAGGSGPTTFFEGFLDP